jgi:electron transfer flavoprotein alpha subunit
MIRRRRDPRAEITGQTVALSPRRRLMRGITPVPATPRLRRDPRAETAALTLQAGTRRRIDRSRSGAPLSPAMGQAAPIPAVPTIRIIDEPAFLVLVVPDQTDGTLSDHDRQVIAAGRLLADAGGAVVALTTADETATDDSGSAGADRVMSLPATEYDPEYRMAAVLAAISALAPRHILFAESDNGGGDLARRVAAALGERLFPGVETLSADRADRRGRGGSAELGHRPLRVMSIAADAVPPHDGIAHEARPLPLPEFTVEPRLGPARPLPIDPDRLPLGETDFIISAGNGVTDWNAFSELAALLGATRGGSRVVCDAGHLARDRQIGASGTVVTARCYLAFGIAGAPQHLQGITEVRHVIAVNTDLHAEMIKRADLAIVADAQKVMPALIRYVRERIRVRERSHD